MGLQRWQHKGIGRIEVVVGLVVLCGAAYLLIPSLGSSGVENKRAACLAQLGRIGKAIGSYLQEHEETWPYVGKLKTFDAHTPPWPTVAVVLEPYTSGDPNVFHCPADRRVLAPDSPLARQFTTKTTWFETEGLSYEWLWAEAYGGRKVGQEERSKAGVLGGLDRADQPLLADFEKFHVGGDGGAFNTLYADLRARTAKTQIKP